MDVSGMIMGAMVIKHMATADGTWMIRQPEDFQKACYRYVMRATRKYALSIPASPGKKPRYDLSRVYHMISCAYCDYLDKQHKAMYE